MRKSAAVLSWVRTSWKHKHGPSPPETVSICLHTLQIIIKRKSSKKGKSITLQRGVFFSELFRFNAWSLLAFASAGLLYWLFGFFLLSVWTGGQQSRFPVPTGTPPAGLHQSPLPARPHLDRGPAHLRPWVLFINFFLPWPRVVFSPLPSRSSSLPISVIYSHSQIPSVHKFSCCLGQYFKEHIWPFATGRSHILIWCESILQVGKLPPGQGLSRGTGPGCLCCSHSLVFSFCLVLFLDGVYKYI